MNRKNVLLGSTALILTLGALPDAQAERPFVQSATGPGPSKTAVNIGVRTYADTVDDLDAVLPTVDFNLVHGLNRHVDYELRASTIGILSLIDTGVKFRIAGNENLGLGARLDATGLLAVLPGDDTAVAALFGLTPGVIVSTGGRRFQISTGLDVPILLGAASEVGGVRTASSDAPIGYVLRPWIGVEAPISRSANFSVQAQAYVSTVEETAVAPNLAVGITW